LNSGRRQRQVVEDVQHGDRHDRGDVEPDRDVEVPLAPDRASVPKKLTRSHPDHRNGDVDRPLELGVLLALRDAEGQGDRRGDDDELPAPEVELLSRSLNIRALQSRWVE
jgi:hypothetical protein